jgi:hypothetical protein
MIYPWKQIGRVAKKLALASKCEKVYLFTEENREILKKYLLGRYSKVLLKDVQRIAGFTEEGVFQSTRHKIHTETGHRHNIALRRGNRGRWLPLDHADSHQSPE